jgi:hypothetical protein
MPSRVQYRDSAINDGLVFYVDAYSEINGVNTWDVPNTQSVWYDLSGNGGDIAIRSSHITAEKEKGYFIVTGSNPGIGQSSALNVGTSGRITIEMFFNVSTNFANPAVLLSYGPNLGVPSTSNTSSFYIGFNDTTLRIIYGTTSEPGASLRFFDTVFSLNTWQCATATFGPFNTGIPLLYRNGTFATSAPAAQAIPTSSLGNTIVIGRHPNNTTSRVITIPTKIGSIKIWNRILTAEEILQSYNTTKGRYEL